MSWLTGTLLLALAGTVGAVILYHRNLRQPVPSHWVAGLVRISAGVVLLVIACGLLDHGPRDAAVTVARIGGLKADSNITDLSSIAALAGFVPNPLAAAPTHRASPRTSTAPKSSATHHLGLSLEQLKQRLGPGRMAMNSTAAVGDPKLPGRSRQLGSAWGWDEGDYSLTCVFGQDGICRQATFYRSLGFNRDQAVTIIRAEIGDERLKAVSGRSHECVTEDGIIVRASENAHSITLEAPELAKLRAEVMAEMEVERQRPIQVR